MAEPARVKRVTIVLRSPNAERGGYLHLLEELQRLGATEATAFQGVASFVGQSPVHTNRVVDFVPEVPVLVVWLDRAEIVDAVLPRVLPLVEDGIITVEDTTIVFERASK
ncbi:MAG: DUF190 domain-containing protein [Dehalococcoidia bacterium]|nr:DUF190 domain-containing protein [Dehalococcoidia bacterium]